MTVQPASLQPFIATGQIVPMVKSAQPGKHTPARSMAGWLATYGKLDARGRVVPTVDRQGHLFEAAGELGRIDFADYVTKGLWNDTHLKRPDGRHVALVGVPTGLEFHDGTTELSKAHGKVGFWTAGHLFDRADPDSWRLYTDHVPSPADLDRADYFWSLANLLKGLPRPLALSIEGKMALDATGRRIVYAIANGAAVCEVPQNPDTTLEVLAKAVAGAAPGISDGRGGAGAPAAVVPEDLEGAPDDEDSPVERLTRMVMDRFMVDRAVARRWIGNFVLAKRGRA